MLARRWPPGLRFPLTAMALLMFLCLAGVQPSVLQSTGLAVQRLHQRSGAMVLRVGSQRCKLFPRPQALWPLQEQQRSEHQPAITGTWLGFKPSVSQRRWLLQHGVGARFIGL